MSCYIGYYGGNGINQCNECPLGYTCNSGDNILPVICPPNYICVDGITPISCGNGSISLQGSTVSSNCSCDSSYYGTNGVNKCACK
jgi:hypothetical protein